MTFCLRFCMCSSRFLTRFFTLTLVLFACIYSFGQNKDFGIWTGGTLKFKSSKKIDLSLSPELRWDQNVSRIRNRILDLGVNYDLPDGFEVGATYRISGVQRNSGWQQRQRLQLGGDKTWKLDDFRIAYKSKVQFSFDKANIKREADQNSNFRNKIEAEYKGLKRIDLGSSIELFHGLRSGEFLEYQAWRWVMFAQYKVSKDFDLKLSYVVDNELNIGVDDRARIIAFGFSYKLN